MVYQILPQDPGHEKLEVHITIPRTYGAIKDAIMRALTPNPPNVPQSWKLVSTKDEPGDHRFELRGEVHSPTSNGSFLAGLKIFDDSSIEVIVENYNPTQDYWGMEWKHAVIDVVKLITEEFSKRGYMLEADRAKLVMGLAPYSVGA